MSDVKRYHVTEAGLVEGQALGRINVVLGADHDRVTAERDAALAENKLLRHDVASYLETVAKVCDMIGVDLESAKSAKGKPSDVLFSYISSMQQHLTAADDRADTIGGLLRLARGAIGENQWTLLNKDIDTMLSQDAGRTNNSRNAHCPHDGICHTSEETCAEAQARIASLTAPAGAGP